MQLHLARTPRGRTEVVVVCDRAFQAVYRIEIARGGHRGAFDTTMRTEAAALA